MAAGRGDSSYMAAGRAVAGKPGAMRLHRLAYRHRPSWFGPAWIFALKLVAGVSAGATATMALWSYDWKPAVETAVDRGAPPPERAARGSTSPWWEADSSDPSSAAEFPRPIKTVTY